MRKNTERYKIVSASAIKNFDKLAVKKFLVPSIVLMENAGKNVAEIILEKFQPRSVAVFCGGGNNGGDGFVVARHLYNKNVKVKVFIAQCKNKYTGAALTNLKIIEKLKIPVLKFNTHSPKITNTDLIVDALLGTGTKGEVRGIYKKIIDKINSTKKPVVSVDIPSGIDADTGKVLGSAVKSNATITMAAIKKGLLINAGKEYSGKIFVVDIGLKF
ncbi:MAG: NAD(P)H-hydrate epimerase [Elusimicrobiota bacterium]